MRTNPDTFKAAKALGIHHKVLWGRLRRLEAKHPKGAALDLGNGVTAIRKGTRRWAYYFDAPSKQRQRKRSSTNGHDDSVVNRLLEEASITIGDMRVLSVSSLAKLVEQIASGELVWRDGRWQES
jgi:hypothetical protein